MSRDWNYKSGDWNIFCDACGKKMKASHAKHRWDGLIVCDEDFEHRHSMDFIKVRPDRITVPFTRPQSTDTYIHTTPWDEDDPPFVNITTAVDSLETTTVYSRAFTDSIEITELFRNGNQVIFLDNLYIADSPIVNNQAVPMFSAEAVPSDSGTIASSTYFSQGYTTNVYVGTTRNI